MCAYIRVDVHVCIYTHACVNMYMYYTYVYSIHVFIYKRVYVYIQQPYEIQTITTPILPVYT